jgi:hypothetical protein
MRVHTCTYYIVRVEKFRVHHVVQDCQVVELMRHVVELTVHLWLNDLGRVV